MGCSQLLAYWQSLGFDLFDSELNRNDNPKFNLPKALPPHQHDSGFDARCGLCAYLHQLAQERGPLAGRRATEASRGGPGGIPTF
jgi:hypothetical protein